MNDDDETFMQQLSASYGQVESALGTEGYKEFLRVREAERQYMEARAARERTISTLVFFFGLIGMLFAMPVLVWLWKWAI